MTGQIIDPESPALDRECRSLVRRGLAAKIVEIDDVKTVVAAMYAENVFFTPQKLAECLIDAELLTPWQASKLLAGKNRGFYLGKYKLLRPLGRRGSGMVYLGEHCVTSQLMAIKVLPAAAQTDARRIERFETEARASAQLNHPNIVRVYGFNKTTDKAYIVMEYIDGIDLHQAVARDGVMSIDAAIDVIMQATAGLAYAHASGIIHGDIQPSNLLLSGNGIVKVSDLGMARNASIVDARADIYSIGCTLYYLLTAKTPFQDSSVSERLAKHPAFVAPDVRLLRTDCPAQVATLITQMISPETLARPASAAELLTQFERIRGGGALQAGNQQKPCGIASMTLKATSKWLPTSTDAPSLAFQASDENLLTIDARKTIASPHLDAGKTWQAADIASFLSCEDDADRERRYDQIRSDRTSPDDVEGAFGLGDALTRIDSPKKENLTSSSGVRQTPSILESRRARENSPKRIPKNRPRRRHSFAMTADTGLLKILGAGVLAALLVGYVGIRSYGFVSGPNIEVIEGLE